MDTQREKKRGDRNKEGKVRRKRERKTERERQKERSKEGETEKKRHTGNDIHERTYIEGQIGCDKQG